MRRVHAGVSPCPGLRSLTGLCTLVLFGNTALKRRHATLVTPAECLRLYDASQQALEAELAQNCQGVHCDNPIYRNDQNYFDCVAINGQSYLILFRELEYKCRPTINPAVLPLWDNVKAFFSS